MPLGKVLLASTPADVSVTQLYGVFNKRAGQLARKFNNTLQMTTPNQIGLTTDSAVAVTTQNQARALLIIQNTSFATVTGDIAPTFYIGFSFQPQQGQGLALPPGVGIVLDVRVPSDAIYVLVGPAVDTHSSVVTQGFIQEGGITDPANDTTNISETGQIAQLIKLLSAHLGAAS
jgi:hypothetical protein